MKPTEYQRLREVFLAVIEFEGEDREARLLEACGEDEKMLAELRRLLASEEEASQFLERGDGDGGSELSPGDRIGPYTLRQPLGEGGFAEVFLAEQQEPVRRRVALKLLKAGMDSCEILARFEAERQALAMMQHSGIAKIFDAGISERGRSWFAMEYVDGVPITDYCDTHRLGLAERLALFIEVCEAIQHAHQKGVIHRDLKPSNILVGMAEGQAQAKVIDFGIAKATGGRLTEKTIFTSHGMLIGTPAYMSPEQAEMSGIDIDTRSDVYSLGILLYELLSGEPPFHPRRLMEAGYGEIQRIIREEEPPRPSTKSTTIEDVKAIAQFRRLDANALRKHLDGDLDWIAMRALEKDRARRYATVQELSADIGRHLADEPVEAGPPSASYRFTKFVRRNRVGVAAGSLVLLTLAAGIAATTWQWQEARAAERTAVIERDKAKKAERQARAAQETAVNERDRAQKAEQDAVTQRDRAKKAQGEAAQARDEAKQRSVELAEVNTELTAEREKMLVEKARLEKVVEFQEGTLIGLDADKMGLTLMRLFREGIAEQLRQMRRTPEEIAEAVERFSQLAVRANPTGVATELLAEEILASAVAAIDKDFTGDPIIEASLRAAVGKVYKDLGLYPEVLRLRERTLALRREHLGNEHPDTLHSINNMGYLLDAQGKLDEAEPYYREALEGCRRVFGDDHPSTLTSISNMGSLLQSQGKLDEAEPYYREALEGCRRVLGDEHPDTLLSISNMGSFLLEQGKLDEAETHHREALEKRRRVLGDEHPDTLLSISHVGMLLSRHGKFGEAEPYFREALEAERRILGNDHPDTLRSINNLGLLLHKQGELDEAERYIRESLERQRRVLGNDHPNALHSISNLGILLHSQGKLAEAEPHYREALEGNRRVLGNDHPRTLDSINNLGALLKERGKLDEAEPHYREALEKRRRVFGDEHPLTLRTINSLGSLLHSQGKLTEAEPLYSEVLEGCRRTLGDRHPNTLISINNLARLFQAQGKLDEAEAYMNEVLEGSRRTFGDEHPNTLISIINMGALLVRQGKFDKAEKLASEAARLRTDDTVYQTRIRKLLEAIEKARKAADKQASKKTDKSP